MVICVLAQTLAQMAAAQETTFDQMDRPDRLIGWEAVGRVDTHDGFCTGTLIARDIVLTAAHCLFDTDGAPIDATQMQFRAGYHNGEAIAERGVLRWVAAAGYRDRGGTQLNAGMIANDVALLQLDGAISSSAADPFALLGRLSPDGDVSVVSYGEGRADVLSRERRCAVTNAYKEGIFELDCDVTFGSSGAPVLARAGERLRILSVISAIGNDEDGKKRAFGMTLPSHVAVLKSRLARAASGTTTASGARRLGAGERAGTGARFIRPKN